MKSEIPSHCNGCDRFCEYDHFTRTRDKAIYPVIGKKIIQDYTTNNGNRIFILPDQIRTKDAALKLAHEISQKCKNHYKNQNTK